MKLMPVRGFFYRDEIRGLNLQARAGEVFDQDPLAERDQLVQVLQSGRAYVCDLDYLPEIGEYKAVASHSQRRPDGTTMILIRDHIVELNQKEATQLLLAGLVVRLHPDKEWSPRDLIRGKVTRMEAPKKLFDDLPDEAPASTFVNKGRGR